MAYVQYTHYGLSSGYPYVQTVNMSTENVSFVKGQRNELGQFVKPYHYAATYYDGRSARAMSSRNGSPYNDLMVGVPTPPTLGYHQNYSVSNLWNKCLAGVGAPVMELGLALGESRESFALIRDRGIQLAKFLQALRSRDVKSAAEILGIKPKDRSRRIIRNDQDLARLFLEYSFGWAPIADDIVTGVEVIQDGIQHPAPNGFVSSLATDERVWSQQFNGGNPFYGFEGYFKSTAAAHAQAHFEWNHEMKGSLIAFRRLGFNPITLAYNLTPWSWFADWFMPVGTYLEAFSNTEGLRYIDGYITHKTDHTIVGQMIREYPNSALTLVQGLQDSVTTYTRREPQSYGIPKFPEIQLDPSVFKALIAMSLLTSSGPNLKTPWEPRKRRKKST